MLYVFFWRSSVLCRFISCLSIQHDPQRKYSNMQFRFCSGYILNNLKILLGKSFNPVVGFKNSFVISIGSTALAAYFSSLTAYALVAYDWKLRQPFFRFIMCVMMIPAQVTTIGFYQMVYKIGLTNHLAMLILPAIASPTMVFS